MKTLALVVLAGATASAYAAPLYSNRGGTADPTNVGLSTGATTRSGIAAPAGFTWSEVPATGTTAGSTVTLSGTGPQFRLADDFVVSGPGWTVNTITVFAYQTGAVANPFTGGNLVVRNGAPNAGGTIIGNGTFASTADTNIYRIFATTPAPGTAPGTTRRVRSITFNLGGLNLAPGTYWLDYQLSGPATAFNPYVTVAGQTNFITGASALQLTTATTWANVVDTGNQAAQDLPFLIDGTVIPAPSALALLGLGGLVAGRRRR
jgi:hypothetical protein